MAEVERPREMTNGFADGPSQSENNQDATSNGSSDCVDSQADPRKLFVGGIPYDAVDQDLLKHFEHYGSIREAVVIRDKNNPLQNQGYGFVIFEDPRIAQWVLTAEKNPIIKGRKANVQKGHKRAGLPSTTNGYHLAAASEAASVLPSYYYTEPLNVMDSRDAAATSLLSLNQMSWPLTNERLLAATGAFANGYPYGGQAIGSVQDQQLHWTQQLLVQQQQQQHQQQQQQQQAANSVYLPQAGVILPTQLAAASSSYTNAAVAAAAAAAAAGISPSSSWAGGSLVHPNAAFNLLGAYVPSVTTANTINAFAVAAAAAANQQVNGLVAAPALYANATQNGTGTNPHALWPEVSGAESQPSLVTYVATPPHTPPASISSLTQIVEQSNGIA